MSSRAIRRAAERQSAKLAAKASKAQAIELNSVKVMSACAGGGDQLTSTLNLEPTMETEEPIAGPVSEARFEANRANAQLSTGPRPSKARPSFPQCR